MAGWCALLAAAVAALVAGPAHAARSAVVGPGHGAGIAVDASGAAYVAWKVEGQDNAAFFCTLPRNATACAAPAVPVPFPEDGFNRGSVTVLLPAPGVVEVVVARGGGTYLARSTDGGRSFAPGVRIFGSISTLAARLADGRVATTGANLAISAGVARPDGADAQTEATELNGDTLSSFYQDVATSGNDVVVSGGTTRGTLTYRLPAGANPIDANAWQPLPAQEGARGRVSGGPAGIFAFLDSNPVTKGRLYVQRLEGAVWGPAVTIEPDNGLVSGTALEQDGAGGLHALWTDEPDGAPDSLLYAASGDGGALWSRPAILGAVGDRLSDLTADVLPDGRGAVVASTISGDDPVNVLWIDPRTVPAAVVRIGDAVVQARSSCKGARGLRVRVRASRAGRAIKVASVLRRATFSARGARRRAHSRYAARFRVRRQRTSARVTVKVRPRAAGERRRKLRFRAVTCRGRL